ncbi:MAG: nitroreductase family protein [Patescibacteria group bacterium]|nr:nitroreductase family protein [Patescibacteria group bacterium]
MNFFALTENRHSVRKFSSKSVSDSTIQKVLSMAQTAPSAGDLKSYRVDIVREEGKKQKLAAAALGQEFVATAPVVLAFSALPEKSQKKYGERGRSLYAVQDATIVCAYVQLAAADMGLGSCWVGALNEKEVRRVLELPPQAVPVALLPIGYEADE